MNEETPSCCLKCDRSKNPSTCSKYATCPRWCEWFRLEWARIRKAAEIIKKSTKEGSAQ